MRSRRVRKIPCAHGRASVDSSYSFLATAFFFLPFPFFPGLLPAFPGVRLRLFPFFFLPGIPGPYTWSVSTADLGRSANIGQNLAGRNYIRAFGIWR